jgi:galactokinase
MPDAAAPTSQPPPFVRTPSSAETDPGVSAAPRLLEACFGGGVTPQVATVRGSIDLQSAQTHYSTGFGLLMSLRESVTVACRPSDGSTTRLVFAATSGPWTASINLDTPSERSPEAPVWQEIVRQILRNRGASHPNVDLAVVSSIPGMAQDAYFAALALATAKALGEVEEPPSATGRISKVGADVLPVLRDIIETASRRPTSMAAIIASHADTDSPFTLVDTGTYEFLPVETEAGSALDWAVIDPGQPAPRSPEWHRSLKQQADNALERLRERGFENLSSFRNVEHQDLPKALEALPEELRPITRHLITENRRVQKHVVAMRRGDWQMIGALMLMSHASLRDQIKATTPTADAFVKAIESPTLDGIYGACMTARDGLILVTGRPHALDDLIASIPDPVQDTASRQGADLHTMRPR